MSKTTFEQRRRRRKNDKAQDMARARRTCWGQTYRSRIQAGSERCRDCGSSSELSFHHILPFALGGRMKFYNATILCRRCNLARGDTHYRMKSLAEEEAQAPLQYRWTVIARAEVSAYREAARRDFSLAERTAS